MEALGSLVAGLPTPNDAWPGKFELQTPRGSIPIAAHISAISSHARKPYEKRFQNPAAADRPPVSDLGGSAIPILLGLDDPNNPGVFVAVDGQSRLGNAARFSILFHERILAEARTRGWSVYESSRGERIYAFVPPLLPAYIEQMHNGEMLAVEQMYGAIIAAGVLDAPLDNDATARATRAVNILVRKAGAGRQIRAAYADKCAMCGIGASFLAGAHIYPVEAPGSNDEVWNGLSLCHNHHSAFDSHRVWVHPDKKSICLHPDLLQEAEHNSGTRHFIDSTFDNLAMPENAAHVPRPDMFRQRYEYYNKKYDWAGR